MSTECLVLKARRECMCDMCKQYNEIVDTILKCHIQAEISRLITDQFKKDGNQKKI